MVEMVEEFFVVLGVFLEGVGWGMGLFFWVMMVMWWRELWRGGLWCFCCWWLLGLFDFLFWVLFFLGVGLVGVLGLLLFVWSREGVV